MTVRESEIEQGLIAKLQDLKYTYRSDIRSRAELERNFREKFEALNRVALTDGEFRRLLDMITTPDVFAAANNLRTTNTLEREDGTPLNFTLVNIRDWCKNSFEVINQLRINTEASHHRYDVIILINGVPVVQIELKNLGISPRRAMQQIVDYKNDPGNGYGRTLLCFMQLFIVTNRDDTWYFSNNNDRHFSFNADERFLPIYRFAAADNRKITRLHEFADQFLAKCTLGETISRYMVLIATEQKLMMMRPYQVYAVKAIVECIRQNCGNGYIWHTTGSGKTLTSFKASTLLKENPAIDKCLFVVDRKDLDRQTRDEFNKFQEDCVEQNTNTESLVERLLSDDYKNKVIVTTIQKLGLALGGSNRAAYKARLEPLRHRRMVFIFDECHRSQFGSNHKAIKEFFPNAQLFGFTGTPIFDENATDRQIEGQEAQFRTTEDLFQRSLHQYTITDAIEDKNVLKFHIDYFRPEGEGGLNPGGEIAKAKVVETILAKHDSATAGRKFNAVLATASINDAIAYVDQFKRVMAARQAEDPGFKPLNIACVFSPPADANMEVRQIQEDLPQEREDNKIDPDGKKAALEAIIADYNAHYKTNFRIAEFDLYYQDVQKRIKDQQYPNRDLPHAQKIDLVIVVDMLLTGFDSKFLNTLYVDKTLRHHGLIQAFSRTNRVLNDTKPAGNILDFRQQEQAVDAAIGLFSGKKIDAAREIWLVEPAAAIVDQLQGAMDRLSAFMAGEGLDCTPDAVPNLKGDLARSRFVTLFKDVQRLKTQLDQYTDLTPAQQDRVADIIPPENLLGFRGMYLETAKRLKAVQDDRETAAPVEVQQLDFDYVLFASATIDYDYIMSLIARMTEAPPDKQRKTRADVIAMIRGEAKFTDLQDLIAAYIDTLPLDRGVPEAEIRAGFDRFKAAAEGRALDELATRHGLDGAALRDFVADVLRRWVFDGADLTRLVEPLGLGWKARVHKETAVMADLAPFLRRVADGRDISGLAAYEE